MELSASDRGNGLIGREHERAAIDALLAAASAGESGCLVVRGEAGIGKSTLLDYAVAQADGMTVLRATGFEAESDLPFAGLYGLLRPVLEGLAELPAVQSAAIRAALGLGPSADADRFLVAAAVLGLLAGAAEQQPLLCVIDDAQWLDAPSADALAFAARRVQADRIAILFAVRDGEATGFSPAGLPELALGSLDEDAAETILERVVPAAPGTVRRRLLGQAAGNPLALLELPSTLTPGQLDGSEPLPEAIGLTPRLRAVFREQVERLPRATQLALLVAATDDTGETSTVVRAAEMLEIGPDALDAAEVAGLIRTGERAITFRHPLVRSALHERATLSERQRVHDALARALSGEEHVDRRVWHQAMATLSADEEVAAALETSGRRAQLRAGHASAATAFERAAELSADASRRIARTAAAAQAAWAAGQTERARAAITRALPASDGQQRADLLHLSGLIGSFTGSLTEACTRLVAAADASTDPSLTLEILLEAADAAAFAGDSATAVALAQRGASVPVETEHDRLTSALLDGFASAFTGRHERARAVLAGALEQTDALDDPRALIWAASAASISGDMGDGLLYAKRAVDETRQRGLLGLLPLALGRYSGELLRRSRYQQAFAFAEEAYRLSSDLGYGTGWPLVAMASVEALWGRDDEATAHAEEAIAFGQQAGEPFLVSSARFTLGFIEVSRGRWERAVDRLLPVTVPEASDTHPFTARAALPDLVEAAARAGREDDAAEPLAAYRAWVQTAPTAIGTALLARCDALLDPRQEAFDAALAGADGLSPFQRARTELVYGEWLRRERRRQDARAHLRSALERFRSLGTTPWEDRAEAELRATGETARKRDPSTLDQLTPQELQIARLVAEGLTNREIASQLILSPRTIDYHLRKVFSKLGISSRTELVRGGMLDDLGA